MMVFRLTLCESSSGTKSRSVLGPLMGADGFDDRGQKRPLILEAAGRLNLARFEAQDRPMVGLAI